MIIRKLRSRFDKFKEFYNKSKKAKRFSGDLKCSYFYRKFNCLKAHFLYQKNLKEISNLKVAVHIHLFYIDLLDEFIENLKNIPIPFDLYITIVDRPESDIKKIFEIFPQTKVFTVTNIGRDVAGLVQVINKIDLNSYDVLIKIHSKKSLHTGSEQKEWRQRLISILIGSKKQCAATLQKFCNPKTGMVGSYEDLGFSKFDSASEMEKLYNRLEIAPREVFFRGTMFAIRGKILSRLLEKKFTINDFTTFSESLGYLMEHAFGSLCISQGYKIKALDDIAFKRKRKPSKKITKLKNYFYNLRSNFIKSK